MKVGKLHVITDTVVQSRYSHEELARMALSGGADTIQFRMKTGSTRDMIDTAKIMKELCEKVNVPLVVNDRVDVALASGAHGVHLGKTDFPIYIARKILGNDKIIGGSAQNVEDAMKCAEEGADYIGFGPIYSTTSKEDVGFVKGIILLQELISRVPLPVIAIGGIDENNAAEVMRSGAHGVAVISAVCCRENPENAAKRLLMEIGIGE